MAHLTKPVLVYVITKSELGGAQGNVFDLIQGFRSDYQVHLVVGSAGPLTEDVAALDVPVHIIPSLTRSINPGTDLSAIRDCVALFKKIQPDLIHAHSSKAGVIARVAGWICRVPTVFTAHGWGFSPGTPRLRRWVALAAEKMLAPLAVRLICVCEYDRQMALRLGVGNRTSLVTIRYGIPDCPVPPLVPGQDLIRLIMVARFNEQKDQATLLRAIAQLTELTECSIQVDFVGSGPSLDACKQLAADLGVLSKVVFWGDRRDVPQRLANAQIFVLSTHYEGLPISILEAMRAGLPVVGTEVNGIPEEVVHGQTGLIVPHEDVLALANGLRTLVRSPELCRQMGLEGRQKFEQEFTVERMIAQTRALYGQILGAKQGQSSVLQSIQS